MKKIILITTLFLAACSSDNNQSDFDFSKITGDWQGEGSVIVDGSEKEITVLQIKKSNNQGIDVKFILEDNSSLNCNYSERLPNPQNYTQEVFYYEKQKLVFDLDPELQPHLSGHGDDQNIDPCQTFYGYLFARVSN